MGQNMANVYSTVNGNCDDDHFRYSSLQLVSVCI